MQRPSWRHAFRNTCEDIGPPRGKIPERKGRLRSAERTEVHLIVIIRFYELTFSL